MTRRAGPYDAACFEALFDADADGGNDPEAGDDDATFGHGVARVFGGVCM